MLLPLGSRRCSGEIFLGKKQGHFGCEEASALAFLWRGRDWLISWRPLATTAGQLLQLHVLKGRGGKLEKKSKRVGSQFNKEGATADVQYCIVHTCASSSLKSLILDSLDELTSAGSRRLRSASSEAYLRT